MELAREKNIRVIEDCTQAHGARYQGRSVGSLGDVAAWSFCQDKIMTTGGEGSMVTTNDQGLWSVMWSFKDHGKSWEAVYERDHPPGFRWVHESFGTNWRMTEMQAAIGRIQLTRIDDWNNKRDNNAQVLIKPWNPLRMKVDQCYQSSLAKGAQKQTLTKLANMLTKYYAYVRPENLAKYWSRDRIIQGSTLSGLLVSGSCSSVFGESL